MIFILHTFLSALYLLIAITSLLRYYTGWKKNLHFTKYDSNLAIALLITLYMQMAMGVYLFYTKLNASIVIQNNSIEDRFWPVEHFFVMFFSILAAQLGYIYSKNIIESNKKFKSLTIHFATSFVLVIFSLAMIFV